MYARTPRRVQMAEEGFQPAPPYKLVDNENTLLDVTDLVFVDAISTGYSRAVAGVNAAQFHGQTGDIRAFGDFINEYLKVNGRWPTRHPSAPTGRRASRRNCRRGTASS